MITMMRAAVLVALALALYAGAAFAGQCYTTCTRVGNTQYCTTTCY